MDNIDIKSTDIINIVVSGDIQQEIEYNSVDDLDNETDEWDIEYKDTIPLGVSLTHIKSDITINLQETGKYVIRGKSKEQIRELNKDFILLFNEYDIIKDITQPEFTIVNLVGKLEINNNINLHQLGSHQHITYEPSSFAAAKYDHPDKNYSCNIFYNGKIIFFGLDDTDKLENATFEVIELIQDYIEDEEDKDNILLE